MELLPRIPQSSWSTWRSDNIDEEEEGWTLLHYAALGDNADAIKELTKSPAVVATCLEKLSDTNETPLLVASRHESLDSMETLIKAGANIHIKDVEGNGLMDDLVSNYIDAKSAQDYVAVNGRLKSGVTHCGDIARLLFRHGLDFDSVRGWQRTQIPQEMLRWQEDWRRHIAKCRSATIALLSVKRLAEKQARKQAKKRPLLASWDKFLLAYMARHVWVLRHEYNNH